MPLVDVIIPVWNGERFISRAIESVLSQTIKDFCLIIVDDGSTDGSAEVIRAAMCRDQRIVYRHQDNGGAGLARNNGIEYGSSKYVLFLDADDEITPSCLKLLTDNMESSQNDFCVGKKHKSTHGIKESYFPEMFSRDISSVVPKKIPKIRYHIAPHAKIIRRDFLELINLRFPVGVTYEDFVFSYELLLKSKLAGVVSALCYLHHVTEASISQKIHNEHNIISRWCVEGRLWELCAEFDSGGEIYGKPESFSMNSRFWMHVANLGASEENVNAFLLWKDLISSRPDLIELTETGRKQLYRNIVDMSFFEFLSYTSR